MVSSLLPCGQGGCQHHLDLPGSSAGPATYIYIYIYIYTVSPFLFIATGDRRRTNVLAIRSKASASLSNWIVSFFAYDFFGVFCLQVLTRL